MSVDEVYDNNSGLITIPGNSIIPSLNRNSGFVSVNFNCKVLECINNSGMIQFERGSCIGNITKNSGVIEIENGSKVDLIADNRGHIILASDCVFMQIKNNSGSIVGGKMGQPNSNSGSTTFRASISIGGGLNRAPAHLWDGHQGTVRKENYSAPSAHVLNDVDQTFCGICMERPKNLAFQCGHMCCVHCSEVLTICHMCRIKIEQKIKLFL